jgi:sulfate/thiosulfate transport system substrate-binding protein
LLTKSIGKGQKAQMSPLKKLRRGGAANASADARPRGGKFLAVGLLALALAGGVAACGDSSASGDAGGGSIDLIAYSTPQTVYEDALIPGFQATPDGEGVEFSNSFAASGDQSRAVEAGQPADVVHFSTEPDMQRVVDSGAVAEDWNKDSYDGIVEDSVVVFVVRSGNPENIQTWDDVVQDGIEVVTPNPFQSGSAKWNLLAAYGAQLNQGKSEAEAEDFLAQLLGNAPTQPASARDATAAFTSGKGDVLLSYENEAIAAQEAGEDVEYVIPDDTILIETPIAATVDSGPEAQAFVDYLRTDEAQQLWADAGYRPVVESVLEKNRDKFPDPPGLFTTADLGGWPKLNADFFDPEGSIVQQIEQDLGVATE